MDAPKGVVIYLYVRKGREPQNAHGATGVGAGGQEIRYFWYIVGLYGWALKGREIVYWHRAYDKGQG